MIKGNGKSVFSGIAIGNIFVYKKKEINITKTFIENSLEELKLYETAKIKAKQQLQCLYEKTLADVGQEEAMIIDVQLMMIDDLDFTDSVDYKITTEKKNLAWAVFETGEEFAQIFAAMDNDYMRAKATDVRDMSIRLARIALGIEEQSFIMEEPMIVIAEDLTPSETVMFDKKKLLGFVTRKGSANSHTAILARTMGFPALVNANISINYDYNGSCMIIDGNEGVFYINPELALLNEKKLQQQKEAKERELLQQLKGLETITSCGKKVNLYCNIGNQEDVDAVLQNDSAGVGLFRSEFLYLGKNTYPTEEEQFESYKKVISCMEGKKVIIRTLDIGADKQADYFELGQEENPAMGYRAIRICLKSIDIFKTQLRAIYRASFFGNAAIMFPMITSIWEIQKIKQTVEEVKNELTSQQIAFGQVELGIMIETPASVMISDELAKEVDFFSVGTNDLTQYTLAIDRQNQKLDDFYDAHHPAILKMLQMVVDNAHKNGIWAGICGELAGDLELTELFLNMGYDELSVSPAYVLPIRKKIREICLKNKREEG